MTNTNNNISGDVLKTVKTAYDKAIKEGDKFLQGSLGPAYKQIKAAANFFTPDAKEIYKAGKRVVDNPTVFNVTTLATTLGTEVLPTAAAAAKPLIRKGKQPMAKLKTITDIVKGVPKPKPKVTPKVTPKRTPGQRSAKLRTGSTGNKGKVPKGESQLSHMKKDVEAAAAKKKAAAEKRAKAAAEKRAKAAAEKRAKAAAAKKKATEETKNNKSKTKPFPIGKTGAGFATIIALASQKDKDKKVPEIEVGPAPKVTALKPEGPKGPKNKKTDSTSTSDSKKDPTEGGRFAFYPGEISRKEGYETMYEVDRNKMSDEVRERLEEAELYEGDSKGGRVGKGKKKKVSKAPRGVRAALRGFKPNIGASKRSKRTRGTGGGWV